MNIDYKLEPIADKYTTNLLRNAFTRFLASESTSLNKERPRIGAV